MYSFVITSYTNSFEVSENGNVKEYQKGVLSLDTDPNNSQLLEINTTQGRQRLYRIDLSVDSVDVNGKKSFADAEELRDTLRLFFFRDTSGGGDQPLIPSQNSVNTFADLPAAADHNDEVWYVKTQTGTWLGNLVGITRKQSGLYKSNGATWEPTNDPLQYWVEGQISFKDNDGTGELIYDLPLSGPRTATWQDSNGTVAWLSDVLPEAPNDGQIYLRKGDTSEWIRKSGLIETFNLSAKEQNQNANNGIFQGVFSIASEGTYNTLTTLFSGIGLGAGQSFQLRGALYDISGNIISQGSLLIDDTTSNSAQTLTLDTEVVFTQPTAVYCVIGVNDNIGGGVVEIFRMNANQTNDSNIAFQFNQVAGVLPNVLPAVGNTNNVRYQIYYAL